jgi:asparagine synthase (glutamine-hydrolysing)
MSIPEKIRNPRSKWNMENTLWDTMEETKKRPEKLLLRYSIQYMNPSLLPKEVLWRTKEAFSDGVSGENGSWYNIIKESMKGYEKNTDYTFNPPTTPEQSYYRDIFEKEYKGHASSIPYFWMPKFVDAVDPSARTLSIYNPGL